MTAPRVLALAALAMLAACSGPKGTPPAAGPRVVFEITPRPLVVGRARVVLALSDAAGQPVTGAVLRVEGNMTHPGMVPVFADARESGPGRYEAELGLTMGGDWIVSVEGKLADGAAFRHVSDVPGVRSP